MSPSIQRSVLPIPDPLHVGVTTYDAKDPDTSFPPIEPLRPPAGAPNVLVVLLDDAGFGSSSAFGGPISTPAFERLAEGGLRFNRFHTTALCSPTRQALLTGRNPHSVGMGGITEIATSAPGYSSVRPKSMAPLAEVLKLNGYSTAQFGKCHEVPAWQTSPIGPFDAWPTGGGGFEHFYGFIGAETNQWEPAIYRDTVPIEPERTDGRDYHFTEDLTDRAIEWVAQQKALAPDKPFFAYFAPGATHAPHHVPKEYADRYAGRFDAGWDALREESVERQRQVGVIPPDAELTARPEEIPAWDDMPEDLKPVLARQMEVYAGFLEHTDEHVGRLLDALRDMDVLDDTLVYVIIGDNGASAEGTVNGTFNEAITLNGFSALETVDFDVQPDRRLRHPSGEQPLRRGLGARDERPLPVDQAGCLALGRHPQRGDRPLAPRDLGQGRAPQPIRPRHRCRPDHPRGRPPAAPGVRARDPAGGPRGRQHALHVRRRRVGRAPRDAVLRDVREPGHLPPGLDGGDASLHAVEVG